MVWGRINAEENEPSNVPGTRTTGAFANIKHDCSHAQFQGATINLTVIYWCMKWHVQYTYSKLILHYVLRVKHRTIHHTSTNTVYSSIYSLPRTETRSLKTLSLKSILTTLQFSHHPSTEAGQSNAPIMPQRDALWDKSSQKTAPHQNRPPPGH